MNGHSFQLQQARAIRMTANLRQAIGALSMSSQEFSDFLEFRARTNPFLELRQSGPDGGGQRKRETPGALPGFSRGAEGGSIEEFARAPETLLEHVWGQASLILRDKTEGRIAVFLIEALEASGWLGRRVPEIARDAGCSEPEVEGVLRKLQQSEPAGLFARSLAECLTLQAIDAEVLDPVMDAVLKNLELVAAGRLDQLARQCETTAEEIADRLRVIRGFDPKPGARFADQETRSIRPDLIVSETGDGWVVDARNPMVDSINVRPVADVAGAESLSAPERDLLEEARSIKRAAERRDETMLRIAAEIVRRQELFLREGPSALRPLRLSDVAEATGVHESTVSRITSDRHIATPRGVLPLRAFFSKSLGEHRNGMDISASAVREEVRLVIAGEDKAAPLSDQRIVEELESRGYAVARRTVAKYRDQLGLGNASLRKRALALDAAMRRRG